MTNEELRLRAICARAGIDVVIDPAIPTACATAHGGKYAIRLGALYERADPEQRATLLAHELAHILRGDLLAPQQKDDAARWNVAADAMINHGLRQSDIAALEGVTYQGLREQVDGLPEAMPSTAAALYDLLPSDPPAPAGADSLESDDSIDGPTHAATVLRARAAAAQEGVDIESIAGGALNVDAARPIVAPKPWAPPARLALLLRALRARRDGALIRTRTYAREGRAEGLRGVARVPRARVLLALDASGSMSEWAAHAAAAARALRASMDATIVAWADRAAPMRGSELPAGIGYGTDPSCLIDHARRADVVVVVTDGIFDAPAAARLQQAASKVVWIITANGSTSALPKGAVVLREGNDA